MRGLGGEETARIITRRGGRRSSANIRRETTANRICCLQKPRDNRLRGCFTITDEEEGQGGGVKIVCKYCQDYVKVLQKFNPTKARTHLTTRCTGVDEALRKSLLGSTQAAKRTLQVEAVADQVGVVPSASIVGTSTTTESLESTTTTSRTNKASVTRRPSPAILSFHPGGNVVDEFLVRYTSYHAIMIIANVESIKLLLWFSPQLDLTLNLHLLPSFLIFFIATRKSLPRFKMET